MKILYIKLENVAGIYIGMKRSVLEIDFRDSYNKIICIIGKNAGGKTCLISSLSPFATTTSLDNRSTLSYILPGHNGYKEIHYYHDGHTYVIKHYFKASKDSHSVKSYIARDGEELNENGNVSSFLGLVEMHLGVTLDMMRLIRLGTNVNSFITLSSAKRKDYIGNFITEVDNYLAIHRKISEDIKTVKVLIQANSTNLNQLHIYDVEGENAELEDLTKQMKKLEKEKTHLAEERGRQAAMMEGQNYQEIKRIRDEADDAIRNLRMLERKVEESGIKDKTVKELTDQTAELTVQKFAAQSKIDALRMHIDTLRQLINRLEMNVKRVSSFSNVESLKSLIEVTKSKVSSASDIVKQFRANGVSSDRVMYIINRLQSYNQIATTLMSFSDQAMGFYIRMMEDGRDIGAFLKEQRKKSAKNINHSDMKQLLEKVFGNDTIIAPNCDTEYEGCPFYRLAESISTVKDDIEERSLDNETLQYLEVIHENISTVIHGIQYINDAHIPDELMENISKEAMITRLKKKMHFFDLTSLQEYLSILKESEVYQENKRKLQEYEQQLALYQQSGIENQKEEIRRYNETIASESKEVSALLKEIDRIDKELLRLSTHVALVTAYQDAVTSKDKNQKVYDQSNQILSKLDTIQSEIRETELRFDQVCKELNSIQLKHKIQEQKINEYMRLIAEQDTLDDKFKKLSAIQQATSTRKGIPVVYVDSFLGQIQRDANELLAMSFNGNLQLGRFVISQDAFEIPYIKNGKVIPDVRYASQSETSLINMALSFAISKRASERFNMVLLDEPDAGFDDDNKSLLLRMLKVHMQILKIEQVFMITHNLSSMAEVNMDVIRLSEGVSIVDDYHHIIYDNVISG